MQAILPYLYAFLVGGAFCLIGQVLIDRTKLTPARILSGYVVAGVLLGALGWYQPLIDFAGAGATVPLTGFGSLLARGVKEAVAEQGLLGALVGGLQKGAAGIAAAILFSVLAALILPASLAMAEEEAAFAPADSKILVACFSATGGAGGGGGPPRLGRVPQAQLAGFGAAETLRRRTRKAAGRSGESGQRAGRKPGMSGRRKAGGGRARRAGGGAAVGGVEPRQSRPQDGLPCGPLAPCRSPIIC